MNSKIIKLVFCTFLLIVATLVMSSAATLTITNIVAPQNVTHTEGTFSVTFNLTYADASSPIALNFASSKMTQGSATISANDITMQPNSSSILTATVSYPAFQLTTLTGIINATNSTISASAPFSVQILPSPSLSLTKSNDLSLSQQNATIVITNTGNSNLASVNLSSAGSFPLTFSSNNFQLPFNSSKTITVFTSTFNTLKFGSYITTVTAKDLVSGQQSNSITYTVQKSFCKNGSIGELEITRARLSNSGDEDDVWKALDEITLDIDVRNNGDEDINDVIVEMGLFDENGVNAVDDLDFISTDDDKPTLGDINDGDKESVTIKFKVPADMETGDYKLTLKAYSDDEGESKICTDTASQFSDSIYDSISIDREDQEEKFIVLDGIILTPKEATCGDPITLSLDVYNVGEDEEDQVRVNLVNSELGVDMYKEIRDNMAPGDQDQLTFLFNVPENAKDKTYILELSSQYDYRSGSYRQASELKNRVELKVTGCAPVSEENNALISASLDSDAKPGKEMVIKASIKNIANSQKTFVIEAKGYTSWATLKSISDRSLTLDAGESEDLTLTFLVDSKASGENSFTLSATTGESTDTREIAVDFGEAKTTFSLFKGNSLIWVIGIINLVLIVLIIIVAVRVSRR